MGEHLGTMTREPAMDNPVTDTGNRFELEENGRVAFATYRLDGDVLVIRHVEAPPSLRGTGAAGRLMAGVTALARERGLKIRPLCSYAAAWMRRHPHAGDALD
jgi:hypothetical protein